MNSSKIDRPVSVLLAMTGMAVVWAQTPAAVAPAFEVASIRPSTSLSQAMLNGSLIGMKISPGRVSIGHTPLIKLIWIAYGIREDQLVGPDWLQSPVEALKEGNQFDIEAKLPEGATAEQVPSMLQTLLADRFKLSIRRERRQTETYALLLGKGGPRFQPRDPAAGQPDNPATTSESAPASKQGQVRQRKVGASTETSIPGGGARIEASTIQGLVDYLSVQLPLPVVDKTGLKGGYDIKMEIHPLGPTPGAPLDVKELRESLKAAIIAGVKELGLDLKEQQGPLDTIIVEHVERTPTEN